MIGKQSSFPWTYFNYSILSCLGVSLFATIVYSWKSERPLYEFLVGQEIASVPMVLFVIGGGGLFGAVVGYSIGQYTKRRLNEISAVLLEVERGSYPKEAIFTAEDELSSIGKRVVALSHRLEEQAGLFQKLTNERVEWSEEMRQATISEERQRLARDLHDSVSQQLFAMSMMMSAVIAQNDRNSETVSKQLQLVENMVINAQTEMRALLLHLRPIQLEGKKLKDGIEELLTELSRKQHIHLSWHIEQIDLEKGVEDHLFRIVQEALSNMLRHSKANKMELRFRRFGKYAILKMMDDGIGFDVSQRKAGSYGLESMQERSQEIGGTFKILSFPNKGTQLEVKIPIIAREEG